MKKWTRRDLNHAQTVASFHSALRLVYFESRLTLRMCGSQAASTRYAVLVALFAAKLVDSAGFEPAAFPVPGG